MSNPWIIWKERNRVQQEARLLAAHAAEMAEHLTKFPDATAKEIEDMQRQISIRDHHILDEHAPKPAKRHLILKTFAFLLIVPPLIGLLLGATGILSSGPKTLSNHTPILACTQADKQQLATTTDPNGTTALSYCDITKTIKKGPSAL